MKDSALKFATLHDKARARAEHLRQEADRLDRKADEYSRRYSEIMAVAQANHERHIAELRAAPAAPLDRKAI